MLKHPVWLLMAVFCIVFSSASKRLIELRLDERFNISYTTSQLINKKIKDGSRDKRDSFKTLVLAKKNQADNDKTQLESLFLFSSPAFLSSLYLSGPGISYSGFNKKAFIAFQALPLYLQIHKLQV